MSYIFTYFFASFAKILPRTKMPFTLHSTNPVNWLRKEPQNTIIETTFFMVLIGAWFYTEATSWNFYPNCVRDLLLLDWWCFLMLWSAECDYTRHKLVCKYIAKYSVVKSDGFLWFSVLNRTEACFLCWRSKIPMSCQQLVILLVTMKSMGFLSDFIIIVCRKSLFCSLTKQKIYMAQFCYWFNIFDQYWLWFILQTLNAHFKWSNRLV